MTGGSKEARGQATVELAMVLPLILGLLLFLTQVGLVMRDQLLVVHAVREGARAAVVAPTVAEATRAAANAGGLDASRMTVDLQRSGQSGELVEVTVVYRSVTEVPVIGRLLGDVTFRETVTMRVETG